MNAFRIVTILIGLVPIFLGVTGIIFGAAEHNGGADAAAALDNQYRYLAGVYIAVGAMILYSAGDVKGRAILLRFALLGWVLGAVGRMVSWASLGEPASWQVSGLAIELIVPAVMILWQARVVKG
ncbi:DUF4345 domain-containing protein [Parasphingorhabdus halotolerans]|uniref:DUF4345 domain-containing protein n=1 Tax=Parasphingorhabdus halotolerans TaxID=2725558 RepID=A0A6H2DMF7_9SPHN|nr:DUF4345 domain-containing protein [Parasphingorhabdus halotolerans]QJB68846.1 DUF4345 domain-containing protein [Parasphingorhabdus halotolerans]